jgi:hypothetical protein
MKTKHRRLWPLLFLPILGSIAGLYVGMDRNRAPFGLGSVDPITSAAFGLLAGSGAMGITAFVVLVYRVAHRRFTIGAILVAIAVIALFLAWARGLLS